MFGGTTAAEDVGCIPSDRIDWLTEAEKCVAGMVVAFGA